MCLLLSIWMRNYGEVEKHQITSSSFPTKQHMHISNVERMTKLAWYIPMKGLALGTELGLFKEAGLKKVEGFS